MLWTTNTCLGEVVTMVRIYTVDKPLFELGNTLGEGTMLISSDLSQGLSTANKSCRVCVGSYTGHQEIYLSTF